MKKDYPSPTSGSPRRRSLTLTRRAGESIRILPDIEVEISEIRGYVVKVTIRANEDVSILRSEVPDRKTSG